MTTLDEFLERCTACGGNWSAMIMSGIRRCFPERFERMEDSSYEFVELMNIISEEGVTWGK